MSNQEKRQQSVRAVTGTSYNYEDDWHALFDLAGVGDGFFNERLKAWINTQLGTSYEFLSDAQKAYAVSQGFTSWAEMGTFSPYDTDALAYFNAMPTAPSATEKSLVDAFIRGLKTDSLWTNIDAGHILCLGTQAQCLIDFKLPSRVATVAGSPTFTFTENRGFTGSGAASGSQTDYIENAFNPASLSATCAYQQDSAHLAVYSHTDVQSANSEIGLNGAVDYFLRIRTGVDTMSGAINSGAVTLATGSTNGIGFFISTRTAAAVTAAYRNGTALSGPTTTASTGVPNSTFRMLQVQAIAGTTRQISYASTGGGLSSGEAALYDARVQTVVTGLRAI